MVISRRCMRRIALTDFTDYTDCYDKSAAPLAPCVICVKLKGRTGGAEHMEWIFSVLSVYSVSDDADHYHDLCREYRSQISWITRMCCVKALFPLLLCVLCKQNTQNGFSVLSVFSVRDDAYHITSKR